jgi:23S rRNA (adenine2503-C2)-methyltransferase
MTKMTTTLRSEIDQSVNFVEEQLVGFIESRYVRKVDDYFICYLSSQTGCNRGCRFCHLTATKQMSNTDCDLNDFLNQTLQVFDHYKNENNPAKYMHYNFMARGEALANSHLVRDADDILISLARYAISQGVTPKFNVSTIMPTTLRKNLTDVFKIVTPTIYYSLYSVDLEFRNKWLPAAMPVGRALGMLKSYQDMTKKIVKIHHCFIKDENDSVDDTIRMCNTLKEYGLLCEFNLVRYNPFSYEQGEESDDETIRRNLAIIKEHLSGKVQMIPRVGFDVSASCGMFVDKKK